MPLFETGRWPSIYDKEALSASIREIVDAGPDFDARFYRLGTLRGPFACQGDIVELRGPVPAIDDNGNAYVTNAEFDHWMVIGNTCDMDREDVPWSQVIPLIRIDGDVSEEDLSRFRRYEYYKRFYVPPWPGAPDRKHRLADFLQPVTIDKRALHVDTGRVVARLEFRAWALLHACIVRFLARDDGRFD